MREARWNAFFEAGLLDGDEAGGHAHKLTAAGLLRASCRRRRPGDRDGDELPEPLRSLLAELVTAATLALAAGERSRRAIRQGVRAASDRLVEWMDVNAAACEAIPTRELMGLNILATLLHRNLELEGTGVID